MSNTPVPNTTMNNDTPKIPWTGRIMTTAADDSQAEILPVVPMSSAEADWSRGYEDGHDAGYTQGFDDGVREGRSEATIHISPKPDFVERCAYTLLAMFGRRGAIALLVVAALSDAAIIVYLFMR